MLVSSLNMINERTLDYFFHHLFLPPKLPDGDDTSKTDLSCHTAIKTAISTMENMLAGRDEKGCLNESSLGGVLRNILSPNTAASFHIKAQNAGILLRCDGNSAIFELFELSPTNGQVYVTKGRLVRKFPAIAVGVQLATYAEDPFQQVLSKTLSIPKAKKAKQNHDEEQETNDPYIVTELLGSFLRGMGHPIAVTGIRKKTREEVIWRQSRIPWRRSPVWLPIRISLHLTLDRTYLNSEEPYKSFMIFILGRVLNAATKLQTASKTRKIMSTKVSRRLLKLRHPTVGTWLTIVHESQTVYYKTEPNLDLKALSGLEMAEDVRMRLPRLNDFISSISKHNIVSKASNFYPNSDIMAFDEEFPSFPSFINQNSLPFILAIRYAEETCQKVEWQEDGITYSQHPAYCSRCALRKEAMGLSIQVHEWPLSSNSLEAKATVFELAVPHSFGAWRDATVYVIDDLLRNKPRSDEASQSPYPLRSYSGLSNFFQSNPGLRVHLLSSAKPHVVTLRRDRVIATSSETDVCVNNGLQFRYFDDHRQRFLDRYTTTIELPKLCTFRLNSPSAHLSKFLIHTHEEPAGETPNSLSLLTQLAMPDLDFNKTETAIFFLQLRLQAGPNDIASAERCAHTRLSNTEFGRKMLERLQGCVSRIRENWESTNALWIFTFLTARLLSMTAPGLKDQALSLLSECREISSKWLEKLRSRLHEMKDEDQRIQFLKLHCGWMFALHRARRVLVKEVLLIGNSCLEIAISRYWPAFRRDVNWYIVSSTCNWLETTSGHHKVHFNILNILNGSLLVNGSPLSRLPREYEAHQDYQKLFGCYVLDVMPSTARGMSFCGCKTFDGYAVHFGMKKEGWQGESEEHLLIHLDEKIIEFIPTENHWRNSNNSWILAQHDGFWKLRPDFLAAIFSPLDSLNIMEIQIPRLRLEFSLKSGESIIRSRQFRGMQIDADHKLLLQDSQRLENRMALIPEGEVVISRNSSTRHVRAIVEYGTAHRVQKYLIDGQLQRLVDDATVQSKLFLAYIHAITSYCISDPFLNRTGIEESLSILESASIRHIDHLTGENMKILLSIAALTPRRNFYPEYLKSMQQVVWRSELSFLTQGSRFYKIVHRLLDGVSAMSFLYPPGTSRTDYDHTLKHADNVLVEREVFRNTRYQVSHFGAEDFSDGRLASSRIYNGIGTITKQMEYGAKWLDDPQAFLSTYWTWINKYHCDVNILQALVILSQSTHLSAAPLPKQLSYDLAEGYELQKDTLQNSVRSVGKVFDDTCPEMNLPAIQGESPAATRKRRKTRFKSNKTKVINLFVDDFFDQWPCATPTQPQKHSYQSYLNLRGLMGAFREYLEEFCFISGVSIVYQDAATRHWGFISVNDLFSSSPPIITEANLSFNFHTLLQVSASGTQGDRKLHKIIQHLELQTKFGFERRYLSELVSSLNDLQCFQDIQLDTSRLDMIMRTRAFEDHLKRCKNRVQEIYNVLTEADRPLPVHHRTTCQTTCYERNMIDEIALVAEFWPRLSPIFFLQQLGRHRWPSLTKQWQKAIVTYGVAITIFQQAQRLMQNLENEVDLLREIQNTGHKSCDPRQYPEWLQLECESGIIIRDVQHQIAEQMIMPEKKENAVMQLNTGEGKSSVIVPIVAAALSNNSQIVRVIVAKPQAKQMHQMLNAISRAIRMDQHRATVVQELAHRCMREGGVIMVQPEHLLSFQLMGLECQINGNEAVGRHLLETQQIFENLSRDIVDESEENFNVKFELIYTIGLQRHIEHIPDRWVVIQEVLDKFAESCLKLKSSFSESLDIDDRHPERFPRIRILRDDAALAVLSDLASTICSTGIIGLSIARQPKNITDAVYRYITHPSLTPQEISIVEESTFWQDTTVNYILLLRGLLSARLAVPFRAKDNPTPRWEFSDPDVVILLTCLSYYYSGLKNDELFETLDLLIRSDNADLEYDAWVKTAPQLPHAFRQLTGINIRDRAQCVDCIFPMLRYSKGAIDYFLSRMVFSKELREFPHKLSSSGWDLGKRKTNLTTGFSGTNDSRYLLPLAIKQLDIPAQNHTNALVLEYLLRPENGIKLMSQASAGVTLGSESLIEMVSEMGPNTRVILDFAQRWLECCKDKSSVMAVVYFNDSDELTVVDTSGKIEPLQISPFATQLDQCLIFLDEAHTRGTDLRLPTNYQAAVTLGANLTKDKLVQACMRMRKLGKGQSVIFCIPKEIEQKILMHRTSGFLCSEQIIVSDVLCWTISETWLDLRRTVPLWLAQGVRFYEQDALWKERKNSQKFLEDEAQSLELRYRPQAGLDSAQLIQRAGPEMKREFESHCEEFGLNNFNSSSLQEEQERELSPETEREQQVEQHFQVKPQPHLYHKDLIHFIKHGEFPTNFTEFKSAFHTLSDYPSGIWATEDFSKTRPVQWILTRSVNNIIDHLVIISPWEAHQLLEKIEAYNMVTLHLYAPRSNLGFEPLDRLALYTVPQRRENLILPQPMMVQLNIFAGQLYLSSFQEYIDRCDILGLAWGNPNDEVVLGPDGFIHPGVVGGNVINKSGFKKSPVEFLRVLFTKIRRNCEVIEKTHIGKIFDGILLREINFESDDKVL
ncbi:hypothetical protein V8C42DRAFT_362285 [Trichoderma barbatum]